ncbi:MAG: autotransporter outer membrane beta-barrel domain-containing protein, partial [Candidatus Thiodiazotropha sp.]|nr:autotransporter outer membrane beta-barrel domain-containing protein [Candidatus Thiodiazotropha sp.]
ISQYSEFSLSNKDRQFTSPWKRLTTLSMTYPLLFCIATSILLTACTSPSLRFDQVAEAHGFHLSVGGGYALGQGPVSFGPYFRASYMRVDIDGYQEQGAETSGLNLSVTDQEWTSFTSVLGVEYAYTISQQHSIIIPQVRLGWVHQFENDSSEITATYVNDPRNNRLSVLTDDPDRNYFELTLGISYVIQDGIQLFADYDTLLGLDNLSDHQLTLGGRWEY